jgi:hypothetical protein
MFRQVVFTVGLPSKLNAAIMITTTTPPSVPPVTATTDNGSMNVLINWEWGCSSYGKPDYFHEYAT